MKEFNKPQYALAIKNNISSFIGFVNDIPVFNNMRGVAYNLSVAINHFVRNGKNTFKIIVLPLKPCEYLEELSECSASVIVKDVMDNATDFIEIFKVSFPPGTSNNTLKLPAFKLIGEFEAKLPFPNFSWVDGPKLNNNEQTNIDKARKYFQKFHSALRDGNTSYVFNEIRVREKELSAAFYDNFESGFSATQKDFNRTLSDKNFQLQPLDFKTFVPKFYTDGKMITFENLKYEQAIFFLNNNHGLRREYPLFLSMNKEGELIISR